MGRWHEWVTPWRTFEDDDRRFRMRIEYGFDNVNKPPIFHFHDRIEEKLGNNRWSDSGRRGTASALQIFPELSRAAFWKDFWPGEELSYLEDARYWWEYAHGLRKPGEYDKPDAVAKAGPHFERKIYLGALPEDAEVYPGIKDQWPLLEEWLVDRHPRLLEAFQKDYELFPIPLEGTGQQETLRLLPPGVRRVIKEHSERIQEAVDGKILWSTILGCGHYGCVMPIEGKDRVLKITSDATEGPVVQAIMNTGLDKSLAGLIAWRQVWQIPDYVGRGARKSAYAIVRDEVKPLGEEDINIAFQGFSWMEALHEYNVAAQRELELKREHMIRMAREQAEAALQKLYNWNETEFVAEAIEILRGDGIVLSDVHWKNLGFGRKSNEVLWADGKRRPALLIFDPGHSQAPPTEVAVLP